MLCVLIENDANQCKNVQTESLGYLTYYQNGKQFFNFAIWSHGAKECSEAKENVAFFTRLNAEKIRTDIYKSITGGACTMHKKAQLHGFQTPLEI